MKSIVIGIGNPLLSDDAVGLRVAREVRARAGTAIAVTELHTGGLDAVEAMTGYAQAVVVDALAPSAGSPGALSELPIEGPVRSNFLSHDGGLAVAVATARLLGLAVPERIVLVGIVGRDVETFATELSEPVAAAVPRAVEHVLALLGEEALA